jgi:CelD/BcsL family acetyltransferase involved in cellulose biosynthesis
MKVAIQPLETDSLVQEWGALAQTSPSGIFATPEWHRAVQEGYGDRGEALVATIRDGGRLMGVAPFRMVSRFLFRDATLLGMGEGSYGLADYAGLLAVPGCEQSVAQAMVAWLRNASWDVLDLQQLPEGPLTEALLGAVRLAGLRCMVRRQNTCRVIPLPATWAEYRARLSTNTRAWLERRPRQTERELGAQVELVPTERVLEEYTTMRNFQAERHGSQPHQQEQRLAIVMRAWLPIAQDRGWLRMLRLTSRSRTIGILLGYEYQGAFYVHSSAFDTRRDLARYGIGASLHAYALRWSIDRGLKRFDMLRGDYAYKERLSGEKRSNFRVMAFMHPLRGRVMEAAVRMRARVKGQVPWLATPA